MKYEGDLMRAGIEKQQSKQQVCVIFMNGMTTFVFCLPFFTLWFMQVQNQLAIYRKLFMEIEREQVRENLRMKEHRKRMIRCDE